MASLHYCKRYIGLTEHPGDGSIEEPAGSASPEQWAEPGVTLTRLQIVPSERDGAEEYGDFFAFSP
jgi:hypothetical protein